MVNYKQLAETYRNDAVSAESPVEFYLRVRERGVSKFDAFVLLRELFDFGLKQCFDVEAQATAQCGKEHA